jgi:hypothetical protein
MVGGLLEDVELDGEGAAALTRHSPAIATAAIALASVRLETAR